MEVMCIFLMNLYVGFTALLNQLPSLLSRSNRAVILNVCAARFARRAAKLSRSCHIEKIIKTVPFNINFEKGTREKFSSVYQIYFPDDLLAYSQRVG
jgi:hypothetical protein